MINLLWATKAVKEVIREVIMAIEVIAIKVINWLRTFYSFCIRNFDYILYILLIFLYNFLFILLLTMIKFL